MGRRRRARGGRARRRPHGLCRTGHRHRRERPRLCRGGRARLGGDAGGAHIGVPAGHAVPRVPRQQLLAHRRLAAAQARALRAVDVAHAGLLAPAAPGLRPGVRRAAGALRHPDHRGERRDPRAGALRLRRRERPREVPAQRSDEDRGRQRRRRRPARDRRRRCHLHAVRDLGHPPARERVVRRQRRRLVAARRTSCAPRAGRPRTPRGCRSCPACCATTRSPAARSTTRSASPPTSPTAASCGPRGTRPAR